MNDRAVALLGKFVYASEVHYPDGRVERARYCPNTGDNDGLGEDVCVYCGGRHRWSARLMWSWFEHEPDCHWVDAAILLDELGYHPTLSVVLGLAR